MELLVYFGAMPVVWLMGWIVGGWGWWKTDDPNPGAFLCSALSLLTYTAAMVYFTRGW